MIIGGLLGRALGVPQAAHLHRPHRTQMMDSVPGEPGPPPGSGLVPVKDGFSDWSVLGQEGAWVITVELGTGETD